jgi:hypothetical protein
MGLGSATFLESERSGLSCGKRQYSKQGAKLVMRQMLASPHVAAVPGKVLNTYHCSVCGRWHVGNTPVDPPWLRFRRRATTTICAEEAP